MYTYVYVMGTKTITVMDDAYDILSRNKMKDESFSDVIRRIGSKKGNLSKFIGILNVSNKEAENMKKEILELRKKDTEEFLEKVKNL